MDNKSFYTIHKVSQEAEWAKEGRKHPLFQRKLYEKSKCDIALEMLEALGIHGSLLDVGCGAFTLLLFLKGKISHLYGIDIAEYSIWKDEPLITAKIADVDKDGIPFSDAAFNCITMLDTLEHLFDPFGAVKEVYRALKPFGYFILSVPNISGIKHRISLLRGRLPITSSPDAWDRKQWDGGHIHYFTLGSMRKLLETDGLFKILDVRGSGRFQLLKSTRPSLFSQDLIILCERRANE